MITKPDSGPGWATWVSGALKFRLNDAWTINYGADANGNVMYFDNQGAHNVTEAGNYTVIFFFGFIPGPGRNIPV